MYTIYIICTKYIYNCTGELLGKYPYDFINNDKIFSCIK